ncbi:MAG: hypothetical protein APF84_17815 [Gracilibacter sp. BRH_c7a]|nr:MAG: hypothetical protein APF84_17815 [Gracilibacter sp. BRH_c7a]
MDNKFVEIVANVLKVDPKILDENSTADTTPGWDSLMHWAVISDLEDIYGVEFTMDEATSFKNLGDIYNTLVKQME